MARDIYKIAMSIRSDWKNPNDVAAKRIKQMLEMRVIGDRVKKKPGVDIVNEFLAEAGAWRGSIADRIKAELKELANPE